MPRKPGRQPRPPRKQFTLTIIDAGTADDAPIVQRLKRFLKAALRGYRIKAVRIVEDESPEKKTP